MEVYGRTLTATVPFFAATWMIRTVVQPASLIAFFAWGTASLLAYIVPVWFIVLSNAERERLLRAARIRRSVDSGDQLSVAPGAIATVRGSAPED